MFGNYQNDKKKKSTNTKGLQFFNKAGSHSTLIIGHWDTALTFKIHPCLPDNKMTETNVYDYDSYVNTVLSQNKVYDLLMACKNFKAQLDAGMTPESVGVASGSGFIQVSANTEEGIILFTIYSDIGAEGKPSQQLSYGFNKSNYFKNYDPSSGSYDKSDLYESEFERFIILLEETIKANTNAIAHTIRYTDMYTKDSILSSMNAIKEKMGIQNNFSGKNNSNTYFNATNNQNNQTSDFGRIQDGGTVNDIQDGLPI